MKEIDTSMFLKNSTININNNKKPSPQIAKFCTKIKFKFCNIKSLRKLILL